MAELYRYAAFISYSSKDAAFARRLHRSLEGYVIPTALGKFDLIGEGKKNRVYPVFRDREELSAGDLSDRIEAGLKASANLIVVCSPNSAASPWVQKEIEHFIALGRRDRIFTIIPDSVNNVAGADARDMFPPAFRADSNDTPLAADARRGKDGFRNSVLKIVAGMISVTPGQIINRDRARRRIRMLRQFGLALASAAILWSAASLIHEQDRRAYLARQRAHGDLTLNAAFELSSVTPPGAMLPLSDRYRGAFPLVDAAPSWSGSMANVWDEGLSQWLSGLPAVPTHLQLRENYRPTAEIDGTAPATPDALVALAPTGDFFLARRQQGGEALSIYDASSRTELAVIPLAPEWDVSLSGTHFALSGDLSSFAVLSPDQSIAIWEFSRRAQVRRTLPAGDCFAFDHGGRRVAVARAGIVEVVDVATGASLGRWEVVGEGGDGCSVTMSRGGDRVAVLLSGTAWVMQLGSQERPMPFSAGQYGLTAGILQFSSDDRLLIASGGRELFRFDVDTGDPLTPIEAGEVEADGFFGIVGPDGVLALIDLWNSTEIWRLDEGVRIGVLDVLGLSTQFTADGRYIIASDLRSGAIQFIDTAEMRAPLSQLHAQFRTPLCSPPNEVHSASERAAATLRRRFSQREALLQDVCSRYGVTDRRFWMDFPEQFRRAWESPRREAIRLRRLAGPLPPSDEEDQWRYIPE